MDEHEPAPIGAEDHTALLGLNNAHAAELSLLDAASFSHLVEQAFLARRIGDDALLISFDQTADYPSPNYLWFRARLPRFVYVDRVVVAERARGRGHARRLYATLFAAAMSAGHDVVACEVNSDPPNPASDAFHAALGFTTVGEASIYGGQRTVRYYQRSLAR